MSKFAWIGIVFAAVMMAGAARSAPATEAVIAETQAALNAGDAQHAANMADVGLNEESISPGDRGRLYLYRGLAEELLGLHDPAMRDFTAALNTHAMPAEERAQALLQRGFLLDGLGRLDEAAKDYTAVIAMKGDGLATALNNRANIYRRQNRFMEARRDYQAALSAGGGKPEYAWYGLGQIAEAEADKVAARGFYAKAVAVDSGYTLALERLVALGGSPDNTIAGPQDRIVLHPPAAGSASGATAQGTTKREVGTVLTSQQGAAAAGAVPVTLQPPKHKVQNQNRQTSAMTASPGTGTTKLALRPALDQAGGGVRMGTLGRNRIEVQLGAWRSEKEANSAWGDAVRRAGGALNGFSPQIVTADLPGKGRYYRLRVSVAAGQDQATFCAGLNAKGIACLPARD